MKVDELCGSLRTFEMSFHDKRTKRSRILLYNHLSSLILSVTRIRNHMRILLNPSLYLQNNLGRLLDDETNIVCLETVMFPRMLKTPWL